MYQLTAPLSVRQLALLGELERLEAYTERTGFITGRQGKRRDAIAAELEQIEAEKTAKRLGVAA